jgi:membrane-associated phospholipid phosphatase
MKRALVLVAWILVVGTLGCAPRPAEVAEPVIAPVGAGALVDWNASVLEVAEAEDGFLTLKGVRAAAMMHLAVHDALSAIRRRYEPYLEVAPSPSADPLAASAQAAYAVAVSEYPDAEERFAGIRETALAGVADDASRRAGIEVGAASAAAVLAERAGDGWDGEAEYSWHPMAPGVYAEFAEHSDTPEGFVFGAGWAQARPFLLASPNHFRSPPPPAIESDAYTRAYDEVREVGRAESSTRTSDQTHLAMWWKEFAEKSHNRLARELVIEEGLELWPAARLFALLNAGIYDAYVNVFENKFHYNHWRPYTAIRWAAHDGNPATQAEPDWTNTHRHTYAFPSYPSAHGTACAAGMTMLADAFGDERPFTMTIPEVDSAGPFSPKVEMDPPTRSFDAFGEAAMECSMSRVYLGIHFRYDSVEGNALGARIGEYGLDNYLQRID